MERVNHARDQFEDYPRWELRAESMLRRKLPQNRGLAGELAAEAVYKVVRRMLQDGARVDDIGAYVRRTSVRLIPRLLKERLRMVPLKDAQVAPEQPELQPSSADEGSPREFLDLLSHELESREQDVLQTILQSNSIRETARLLGLLPEQVRRSLRKTAKKGRMFLSRRDRPASEYSPALDADHGTESSTR